MPRRIAITSLNASTVDIINTIRANANYEYQSLVPEITQASEIPRVGEVLFGYPALANQFINALINRIALVRVKSATFNNAYAELKKGYLEFGETVEEVFVEIAKAREFSAEKAEKREFKRTLPDVRTAFHVMNWRVQYPVTIQENDLHTAFQSINGVQDLIAKIVDSVHTAAEYDEYLLFKYLMIKAIAKNQMHRVYIGSTMEEAAVAYRGTSNMMTFMKNDFNNAGVHVATPKNDQYIFMDAMYNASYDVGVLASAFNMEKVEFSGKLKLVDDWSTFDNERFEVIRSASDMIEEVTQDELNMMKGVKAILLDGEWFQVYDNMTKFTECYVSSGLYWNYNLNIWKTVSSSPFSNAVVFIDEEVAGGIEVAPASINLNVIASSKLDDGTSIITVNASYTSGTNDENTIRVPVEGHFVQTEAATKDGVAVHPYGAIIIPKDKDYSPVVEYMGVTYKAHFNEDAEAYQTIGTNINSYMTLDAE